MSRFGDPNPTIRLRQRDFMESVFHECVLPRRIQELIRLRIAFHNQCRHCMAMRYEDAVEDGVTEDLVCSLERPQEAKDLTDADRAALRFADLFATDHLAIDGPFIEELRQYFTEREIYEISISCATFVGFGRLAAISMDTDTLPEEFRRESEGPVTPWGARETMVVRY
jgi:AhpD family alkylhydroperoxidase